MVVVVVVEAVILVVVVVVRKLRKMRFKHTQTHDIHVRYKSNLHPFPVQFGDNESCCLMN